MADYDFGTIVPRLPLGVSLKWGKPGGPGDAALGSTATIDLIRYAWSHQRPEGNQSMTGGDSGVSLPPAFLCFPVYFSPQSLVH